MKKTAYAVLNLFSLLRGGRTKDLRCRPFANSRNPRAFHPQDSPRRGRVPVQCETRGCLPLGDGIFGFRAFGSPAGGETKNPGH